MKKIKDLSEVIIMGTAIRQCHRKLLGIGLELSKREPLEKHFSGIQLTKNLMNCNNTKPTNHQIYYLLHSLLKCLQLFVSTLIEVVYPHFVIIISFL